jgi:hypothetical protein
MALLRGRLVRATRPLHFFRSDGPMPEAVETRFVIPRELGPEIEVLAELRERVQAVKVECTAERQRTGQRVYGRRAVLAQSWRGQPATCEPRAVDGARATLRAGAHEEDEIVADSCRRAVTRRK